MHAHADVLVVGAGPAGLAAARSGARVILADERAEPGGSLHDTAATFDGAPAAGWADRVASELVGLPEVRLLPRTTVVGYYDHNYLIAVERRTSHLGAAVPGRVARRAGDSGKEMAPALIDLALAIAYLAIALTS